MSIPKHKQRQMLAVLVHQAKEMSKRAGKAKAHSLGLDSSVFWHCEYREFTGRRQAFMQAARLIKNTFRS